MVVIGFVGSVFSPYYALARRRGPSTPENHVAINVALYGPGGRWAMTERGQRSLRRSATVFEVGPSRIERQDDGLVISLDEIAVPLPRRVRGTIRVALPGNGSPEIALDPGGRHHWRAFAPASRITVELDRPALRWSGTGYVDHNRGDEPIEDGFSHWSWARFDGGAAPIVTWDLAPRAGPPSAFALDFRPDGTARRLEAPPAASALPTTAWGIARPQRADATGAVRLVRTMENAPFYARSEIEAELFGRRLRGVHESLSLDRFRMPIVQAMLPFRMPRRA